MSISNRKGLFITFFFIIVLFLVPSVYAQSKSLVWHRWDADIYIHEDGTFTVIEQFEIEFVSGTFTFGFRNIPIEQFERIRDITVREGGITYEESHSESEYTYYSNRSDGEYVINWFYPPSTNQTRVFTVEYVVEGGLFISEEFGDRLFWKAVGPEHAFPVDSSTVTLNLPSLAVVETGTDEPASFVGVNEGSYHIVNENTIEYEAVNIPSNVYFEVGAYFTHGVVDAEPPAWQETYMREQEWDATWRPMANLLLGGFGILLLILGPLSIYLLWMFAGRDPEVGAVPEYLSAPPSELPPGVAGTLIDEKADLQDIMATLVDLARRGVVEMEEKERSVFGITTSTDFVFRRTGNSSEPLREYELLLIKRLFGSREEIELKDVQEKFYTAIPKLQQSLYEEAVKEDLFPASPKAVRGRYMGLGIAGLVLAGGVGFCAIAALGTRTEAILCPFVSIGVTSIILIIVSNVMPAKTNKGAEEAAKWDAFKTYLRKIDRYTQLEQVTQQFEQYLPYAIAFGLERSWINKFSRVPSTPIPRWYLPVGMSRGHYGTSMTGASGREIGGSRDLRGEAARPAPSLDGMSGQMFSGLNSMSTGLFSMLNSTSRALTSVPHTSSGSSGGFSGGGFSGGFSSGGGGGGGGAGFG